MLINYALKPISLFPNKKVQFICLVQKFFQALMIIFDEKVYLIGTPTILLIGLILSALLNNKSYNLQTIKKRKYFGYLAAKMLIVMLMTLLIIFEIQIKN